MHCRNTWQMCSAVHTAQCYSATDRQMKRQTDRHTDRETDRRNCSEGVKLHLYDVAQKKILDRSAQLCALNQRRLTAASIAQCGQTSGSRRSLTLSRRRDLAWFIVVEITGRVIVAAEQPLWCRDFVTILPKCAYCVRNAIVLVVGLNNNNNNADNF